VEDGLDQNQYALVGTSVMKFDSSSFYLIKEKEMKKNKGG
jgi:hypothetical protein